MLASPDRWYCDPAELLDECLKSQAQGNVPTARFCELIRLLAGRFLRKKQYSWICPSDREDIVSAILVKCCKSIKNIKTQDQLTASKKKQNVFSYFTRAAQTTTWLWLEKRQKLIDLKKGISEEQKARAAEVMPMPLQPGQEQWSRDQAW